MLADACAYLWSMQGEDGQTFEVEIPAFPLESPWSQRTLH